MNKTIFKIKLIDWALILTWLSNSALWFRDPQFMFRTGASYIVMGTFFTILFIKIRLFSAQERAENFSNLKKRLPLLLYMVIMGILIHKFLDTVYWAPKQQKIFDQIQEKYEKAKAIREKNSK